MKKFNCLVLFIILLPLISYAQFDNYNINKSLIEWKNAWDKKDITGISNLITEDYEYYNKNSVVKNKNSRINEIKIFFKKYKKVGLALETLKLGDSTSSQNDVKVIFKQYLVTDKTNDYSIVTMRFFKGDETNNKWKIYREIAESSEAFKNTNIVKISDSKPNASMTIWYILIITLILILFLLLSYYLKTKCPNCRKAFVYKKVTKELYRKNDTMPKRYKNYRYNPDGTEKDYTWETRIINISCVAYKDYYNCTSCEYKEESKPYIKTYKY